MGERGFGASRPGVTLTRSGGAGGARKIGNGWMCGASRRGRGTVSVVGPRVGAGVTRNCAGPVRAGPCFGRGATRAIGPLIGGAVTTENATRRRIGPMRGGGALTGET